MKPGVYILELKTADKRRIEEKLVVISQPESLKRYEVGKAPRAEQ